MLAVGWADACRLQHLLRIQLHPHCPAVQLPQCLIVELAALAPEHPQVQQVTPHPREPALFVVVPERQFQLLLELLAIVEIEREAAGRVAADCFSGCSAARAHQPMGREQVGVYQFAVVERRLLESAAAA